MVLFRATIGSGVFGSAVLGGPLGAAVPMALMAPEASTTPAHRTATPVPAEPAAPEASDVPPTLCRCGHDAAAHEHYRRGSDCGACGAQSCARFRAARRGGLRGWLRGRRGRRAG
jgi:hypothetical protein